MQKNIFCLYDTDKIKNCLYAEVEENSLSRKKPVFLSLFYWCTKNLYCITLEEECREEPEENNNDDNNNNMVNG